MLTFIYSTPSLINLLVFAIVVAVVLGAIAYATNQMAPPAPIRWLIWGIVIVVMLIAALRFFGVAT